ncbi:MAG: UTP--glucose-1-phosphate uridylyltransferase [Nitrospirae bacterium]|nr:UTP--glucose-1-phosphate uridylyltransferase [Nitrospirota bacterium]
MPNELIETITSQDDPVRNRSITSLLRNKNSTELIQLADEVEAFRISSGNLYHKVRASLFLFVIYRHYLQVNKDILQFGKVPFEGVKAAFERDFELAITTYLAGTKKAGSQNSAVFSALAESYYNLAFKYLLDQVKLSISQCAENYLLFNINEIDDYPYYTPVELITPDPETGRYPVGMDASPVRLDPSHSGWSDIFFLGMDFPEGARVVNLSVDLRIHGSDERILPPCECYTRFIEDPVIHLISIDLKSSKRISTLQELFNFGNDYLSLLKAGVVASGIVPPCFEGKNIPLKDLLHKLLGKPGGIEVVTKVNGIPKGSRLAVSTTLISTIITSLMRFSGQIKNKTGTLTELERRTVASRAILGEWLGGSGGGWQDSGGLWPGIKVIMGKLSGHRDTEHSVSRGCLLPEHNVFSREEISKEVEQKILDSMVLVHGGISQDVGPILEMVTEKYLLKYEKEWDARLMGIKLFDEIVDALKTGDMKTLGRLTTEDWEGPIQDIIPWVNNAFTEALINKVKNEFGDDYWGFLMLGGMSGGGMAFIVNPKIKAAFKNRIADIMHELKQMYNSSLPFIIDPVVYDFKINHEGIAAKLLKGKDAVVPEINNPPLIPPLDKGGQRGVTPLAKGRIKEGSLQLTEDEIKNQFGFDVRSHEHMKALLKRGEIGLAKNRLPLTTKIEDVSPDEIFHFREFENPSTSPFYKGRDYSPLSRGVRGVSPPLEKGGKGGFSETGLAALKNNEVAVVTFAGGMGSRWTQGAAVVKSINPFIKMAGAYRTFIEIHLAKSRKTGKLSGRNVPHVFTTSYLTHDAVFRYLDRSSYFNYEGKIYLSPAKSIAHRVYPMERDLRFHWEEQLQQKLSENVQKVQDDVHRALIEWARSKGEGEDYSENKPMLRFNPPGHWYEVPNLIKNGVLAQMLRDNTNLRYLFCHNVDTLGADVDPHMLGMHIENKTCMTFEVTPRRIEDAGGGLAKINGHVRLVEGMALPREEDEYGLSFYNTNTNWTTIDPMLEYFGLDRNVILDAENSPENQDKILDSIHAVEKKIPAYVTLKDVKYVWGSGQEDVYPVAQFEKIWGDMTGLTDLKTGFVSVARYRGQQLKEPALLDTWANDGSFEYVKGKVIF